MTKLLELTLLLFLVATGCSDDNATGPDNKAQLTGTWKATEYVYTSG